MTDKELLAKLDRWHDENKHQEIIREIEGLPEEQRQDYELQGKLARALNNTGRYHDAIRVLEAIRDRGEQDDRWWSRMGYAHYQLDHLKEAQECFFTAQRLNPGNEDAKTFLAWMNVGPSGKANAWDGGAARKGESQSGAANNGWSGGETAGERRSKPETANGWASGDRLTGKRAKGDGGISQWEGQGWEGTAQLETRFFGSLRFPVKEGLFDTFSLTIDGERMVTELFIREELARPERWEALTELLDNVPEMYRKARARMLADAGENEVIRFFVRDQVAEMDEEPLLRNVRAAAREEITAEQFLKALNLKGITVNPRPGAEEEMVCALDFCLDQGSTDQLLVFRFTPALELYDISHES